jgi:hypothetical protein
MPKSVLKNVKILKCTVVIKKLFGPPSPSINKVARKALVVEKHHDLV